jgi:hypothetical protein
MWGLIFDTLFDFLPWKVQLALLAGFILIVAAVVFWATRG